MEYKNLAIFRVLGKVVAFSKEHETIALSEKFSRLRDWDARLGELMRLPGRFLIWQFS